MLVWPPRSYIPNSVSLLAVRLWTIQRRKGREEWEGIGYFRTQTLKLRFLYVTDSTLKPMVGIVVTTSPICAVSAESAMRVRVLEDRHGANLESIQERRLAGIVLRSTSSAMRAIPWEQHSIPGPGSVSVSPFSPTAGRTAMTCSDPSSLMPRRRRLPRSRRSVVLSLAVCYGQLAVQWRLEQLSTSGAGMRTYTPSRRLIVPGCRDFEAPLAGEARAAVVQW